MLIDVVVLLGVAVVLPLALGRPWRWLLASLGASSALVLPVGVPAAAAAAVWLGVASWGAAELVVGMRPRGGAGWWHRPPAEWSSWAATGFAVVAAAAFVASRGGLELFGVGEPIVELTAVHFTYAGVGAVTLAGAMAARFPRAGRVGLVLTVVAPPVVATGFLLAHPLPQVGGAVLMSAGVLCTAALQLAAAASSRPRGLLLGLSGLAPWVPMGLAVAWASSLYWSVPALSIPDMARTHGVMNVVFVLAGLVATRRPTAATNRRTAADAVVAR